MGIGAGIMSGLLGGIAKADTAEEERQYQEAASQRKARIALLTAAMQSPAFDAKMLPEVIRGMEEAAAPVSRGRGMALTKRGKGGLFPQLAPLLEGLGSVFMTPEQMTEREIAETTKKTEAAGEVGRQETEKTLASAVDAFRSQFGREPDEEEKEEIYRGIYKLPTLKTPPAWQPIRLQLNTGETIEGYENRHDPGTYVTLKGIPIDAKTVSGKVAIERTVNTAEEINAAIAEAWDKGDMARVKELQKKREAIVPFGTQKLQIQLANLPPAAPTGSALDDMARAVGTGVAGLTAYPKEWRPGIVDRMQELGLKTPTTQQTNQLAQVRSAMDTIKEVRIDLDDYTNASLLKEPRRTIVAAKNLADRVNALAVPMGRALGEVGVFTDQDRAVYAKILSPGLAWTTISPAMAKDRLDRAEAYIRRRTKERLGINLDENSGTTKPDTGARKINSSGDEVEFDGGKWVLVKPRD